ncbi:hypothetical protein BCR32DRAFT_269806, partial [Anaeromyces robustus]
MDLKKLKHYWIFLLTLLSYGIGVIIHFIAQYNGNKPQSGREVLVNAFQKFPTIKTIINTTNEEEDNTISKFEKPNNLFYFVQITDIHMDKGKYLGYIVGTVENEWQLYQKIIEETGVIHKNNGTFLWDMRGNHDCFMVPDWTSEYNYFNRYSKTKSRGFSFQYETSYGTYSFIGIDGCPILTAACPFFGIIDEVTLDMYSEFMDKAKANPNNKHNFVFSHYTKGSAKFGKSSSGKTWEDYTKDISLFMTGHLHNLGGNKMYTYHKDYLEMELNDLKLHGKYRIVSIDNDIVSISDNVLPLPELPYDFKTSNIDDLIQHPPLVFNQNIPPIVHITSPKDSHFIIQNNNKEPIKESLDSGYIR